MCWAKCQKWKMNSKLQEKNLKCSKCNFNLLKIKSKNHPLISLLIQLNHPNKSVNLGPKLKRHNRLRQTKKSKLLNTSTVMKKFFQIQTSYPHCQFKVNKQLMLAYSTSLINLSELGFLTRTIKPLWQLESMMR
jgi:hypothetical protein